jgi:hypothetical protein
MLPGKFEHRVRSNTKANASKGSSYASVAPLKIVGPPAAEARSWISDPFESAKSHFFAAAGVNFATSL